MPELAEIETLVGFLQNNILNQRIVCFTTYRNNLRYTLNTNLKVLTQYSTVIEVQRRAKFVHIKLSNNNSLIIHLGMSGNLTMEPQEYKIKKHDHIQIIFASGQQLIFHDPRRFGMVYGCASDEFDNQLFIKHMGIEPLDSRFNVEYLKTKLQKRSTTIKTAIMDNKIVVGIGNIYIAESLHKSGIHPTRIAAELTHNEIQNLVSAIKIVLTAAIKVGGTTLKNFVNGDNKHGDFKQQLRVYNRTNQQCYTCQTGTIHRIKQAGRSSFFCPNCQRD